MFSLLKLKAASCIDLLRRLDLHLSSKYYLCLLLALDFDVMSIIMFADQQVVC